MPNHFHGIIEIHYENYFLAPDVGNGLKPFPTKHGLSEFVRALKTFSSRRINEKKNNFHFAWQKSFHDRVIRDEDELANKQNYILSNPGKWSEDRNNPKNFK
jgi:REP element-mobilizing transposase RayT